MPEDHLQALLERGDSPGDLAYHTTMFIGQTVHADYAGLLTIGEHTHTYQVVSTHPDLSTALLAYLGQRTRSVSPLARAALDSTQPIFIDHYPSHPDALQGGVLLGVNAVAHLPLGSTRDQTYIMTFIRVSTSPTHRTPWTQEERAFLNAAVKRIHMAITGNADST